MIKCKQFPDKTFSSKEDLFKALRENVDKIIALKKAAIQKSCDKGYPLFSFLTKEFDATKADFQMQDGFIYPVINSTRYLDSHDDVHFDGIWKKSLKEQQGKLFYVADHDLKLASVIAYPNNVKSFTANIPWSFVGKNYEGETEALIFQIAKDKIVSVIVKDAIEKEVPLQNSVRMQYVKIKLGINSDAKEDVDFKAYFDSKIDLIANKDVALEQGYFFGVEEAKIVHEGSMVLFGSNDATSILTTQEAAKIGTLDNEPLKNTQKDATLRACPNCLTDFNCGTGSANCPNCGQFVEQTDVVVPFDLAKAITEIKLFNN
jgi:uncharacterized protein (UPF0212 family)